MRHPSWVTRVRLPSETRRHPPRGVASATDSSSSSESPKPESESRDTVARTVSALSSRCSGSVPLWSEASPTSRIAFGLKYRANKKPVFGVAAAGLAAAAVVSRLPSGDSSLCPRVKACGSERHISETTPRTTGHRSPSRLSPRRPRRRQSTRTTLSGSSWRRSTFVMADEKTRERPVVARARGYRPVRGVPWRNIVTCSKRRAPVPTEQLVDLRPARSSRCSSIALDKMRELASPLTLCARGTHLRATRPSLAHRCPPSCRAVPRRRVSPSAPAPSPLRRPARASSRVRLTDDASHVVARARGVALSLAAWLARRPRPGIAGQPIEWVFTLDSGGQSIGDIVGFLGSLTSK